MSNYSLLGSVNKSFRPTNCGMFERDIPVLVPPGQMAFTRTLMPLRMNSAAAHCIMFTALQTNNALSRIIMLLRMNDPHAALLAESESKGY